MIPYISADHEKGPELIGKDGKGFETDPPIEFLTLTRREQGGAAARARCRAHGARTSATIIAQT
jgi:hypothetical protein